MKRLAVAVLLAVAGCSAPNQRSTPSPSPVPTPTPTIRTERVAVIGDWGAGTSAQAAVARAMCEARKTEPFRIVVTTGDNFYAPDGTAIARNYHTPMGCLLAGGVTWRATWGNHDVGHASTRTTLGAGRWYRWSLGGVDFFMLDSNVPAAQDQRTWLRRELGSSAARAKVVVFHHPPFTAGTHEGDESVQAFWVPLFERYGVTLVLNGHNHDYEHLVVNGIDYVISGGGGARLYPCIRAPDGLKRCLSRHHFVLLEIRGDALELRALDVNGEELDSFAVEL